MTEYNYKKLMVFVETIRSEQVDYDARNNKTVEGAVLSESKGEEEGCRQVFLSLWLIRGQSSGNHRCMYVLESFSRFKSIL